MSPKTPARHQHEHSARSAAGALRRHLAHLLSLILIGSALTAIVAVASPHAAHAATLRRVVNASHPLLLMQLVAGANLSDDPNFRNDINKEGWDVAEAWSNIPDDIKPYVAFVLHPGHNSLWTTADAQAWMTANVAEAETLNVPVLALWGEQPTAGSGGLSYIQSLYEDYPNFIGTAISELTGDDSGIPSLLALANEYGGYHVQSSIESAGVLDTKMDNSTFYNEITADAANFIYAPKNTHDNFDSVTGQAEGDWLSGVAGNWGPYFDGYAYYGCGIYGEASNGGGDRCSRSEPEEGWGQTMLDDYMGGATVYHFENQTDAPGFENQYTPAFWQSILPAFRYIIAHPAPSAAQVIANTKVAFSEAKGSIYSLDDTVHGSTPRGTFYEGLSENPTDALVNQGLWWFPRGSGQYYFIPVLPELAPSSVVSEFSDVVTATSYNSSLLGLNNKLSYFNKRYPKLYSGDAFVQNLGTQWLVYNTHYTDDTAESADIPLTNGSQWSDIDFPTVNPNTLAMINDNSTSLGILLDNYTTNRAADLLAPGGYRAMEFVDSFNEFAYTAHPSDTTPRTDVIRVRTTSEPTLTISGYDGHYTDSQEWNPNTDIYTLTVNHNGVVEINLDHGATDAAAEGWTRTDDASSAITYGGSWTAETGVTGDYGGTYHASTSAGATASYEFNGTSVEWLANTVSGGGTASVYIDGTLFASGVSLNSSSPSDGAVIWRTTGLTNQPHTIKIVATSGDIGLDRFADQPSQLWMINDIDEQNFSYGTAATAEGYRQGSDHWVITNGQMKILPYVAPWTSDVTVYNTNDTYTNSSGFTYSAKITSGKGTPGGLLFDASPTAKTGYYFFIDPTDSIGDTKLALVKIVSGNTFDVLAEDSSASISDNTAYTLSVTVSGSSITGYLNGSKALSATDSSYTSGETGVRVPDNVGGVGDFVYVTDPTVTVGGKTSYSSTFGSWSAASGWVTDGALVIKADWPAVTSFDQPWNWARTGGTWAVVNNDAIKTSGRNGVFQGVAGSSGTSTALAGSTSWEDYQYSSLLEFPSSGSTGAGGLIFRAKDANDYYELSVTRTSISLVKDVAGTLTTLATAGRAFSLGDWYALAVTSDGDRLSATVNGMQVLSAEDSTYRSGEVGYAAGAGDTVDLDDATIMQLPTAGTGSTPPAAVKIDPVTTAAIAGYAPVIVKTPLGTAPALPSTVTAYYENGTTGSVAVTWPKATSSQLATADTPYAGGESSGNFTLTGTVSGASVSPTVEVEVQPVLDSTLSSSVTVTSGETDFLPLSYGNVKFNAGSLTYTRSAYIIWNTVPNTSTMTPGQTVTVQGTIEGYPYETATAKVTLS